MEEISDESGRALRGLFPGREPSERSGNRTPIVKGAGNHPMGPAPRDRRASAAGSRLRTRRGEASSAVLSKISRDGGVRSAAGPRCVANRSLRRTALRFETTRETRPADDFRANFRAIKNHPDVACVCRKVSERPTNGQILLGPACILKLRC